MKWATVLACVFALGSVVQAQSSSSDSLGQSKRVRLTLADGSELVGTIVSEDSLFIRFRTLTQIRIEIPRDRIRGIRSLEMQQEAAVKRVRDPGDRWLLFGPTARGLSENEISFSVYELVFPSVAFGVGNAFTLEAGMSVVPSAKSQLLYFAPKVTPGSVGDIRFAAGLMYAFNPWSSSSGVGIAYGVITWESPEISLTSGLGWGIGRTGISHEPLVELGAELETSRKTKLLFELLTNSQFQDPGIMAGLRWYGESLSANFGFLRLVGEQTIGFPLIPILSVSYRFGG